MAVAKTAGTVLGRLPGVFSNENGSSAEPGGLPTSKNQEAAEAK